MATSLPTPLAFVLSVWQVEGFVYDSQKGAVGGWGGVAYSKHNENCLVSFTFPLSLFQFPKFVQRTTDSCPYSSDVEYF